MSFPEQRTTIAVKLAARLVAAQEMTTRVGARIRPRILEQGEPLPAIAYGIVSTIDPMNLGGPSGEAETRVQFNCYALDADMADLVGELVIEILHGFVGYLGDGDDRQYVYDCCKDNDYPREDPPTPGDQRWRFRRVIDFNVNHTVPVPSLALL